MDVDSNWWETFFHGVAVELWLQAMSAEHTRHEAAFIARALAVPPGAELLDVPCGGGRLSVGLASRGYRMTGVDLSSEFLGHARAADAARAVAWEQRDMRDLPWPARFDGAFCFGNSFGYLDDEGNAAFLHAVASTLKPGARFLLDTPMVLESLMQTLKDRFWVQVGDMHLLIANRYDLAGSRLDIDYTFIRDGRVETRRGTHRAYSYRELIELVERAGFEVESSRTWARDRALNPYADDTPLATEPYRVGAQSLLLTAKRT